MKKIPSLFTRIFDTEKPHAIKEILNEVNPSCRWVLRGEGVATEKIDGACCCFIDGVFYKRYDCKNGKKPPKNAIPCQKEPDPITGHFPHWVPVSKNKPSDKWFVEALNTYMDIYKEQPTDGTYEAVGAHFNNNPYNMVCDFLEPHGSVIFDKVPRDFEGIKQWLSDNPECEGIVFHRINGAMCKIKRTDFGFEWNSKKETEEERIKDEEKGENKNEEN